MLELFVRDANLNIVGEISDYDKLTIERSYTSISKLVLRVPKTRDYVGLLKIGNILSEKSQYEYGYVIEHFSSLYVNGEDILEIYAYSLNRLIDRRVIYQQQRFSGDVVRVIENFVRFNCIEVDTERVIPNLSIRTNSPIGVNTDSSRSGGTVAEQCYLVANANGASFDVLINGNNLELRVWKGADRTINSATPVIFSREFDNVLQQNYFESLLDYKNVAVVAGEGEGVNRKVITVSDGMQEGVERREIYVDARDLQRNYYNENNVQVTLTESQYEQLLSNRGLEVLNEQKAIKTFEAVINDVQYVLGRDYFLGDVVTFMDSELDVTVNYRINKVTLTSDVNGVKRTPSFGDALPNKLL